ncbi:unnamed protein product [Camellia sinensis]
MDYVEKIGSVVEKIGSAVELGKNLYDLTAPWVGYHNDLDTNIETLKRKTEQLNSRKDDIDEVVSYAEEYKRKRRRVEVTIWQEDVRRITCRVRTLELARQEVQGLKNAYNRKKLGKCVVETIKEVEKLHENGGFSNGLLIDNPTCGHAILTAKSLAEATSERNKEKIWKLLMDDAVRKIGVHGMGGIGKTTIMKHIYNQLLVGTSTFSEVIWVTISKAFDIKNLQRQIAKKLNFDLFDYEDELHSASEIRNKLSQKKGYVLILDDLWEAFRLKEVGIPKPTRDNGCKLVLTTRSLEVCAKMKCSTVEMELLTEEEALNLFMKDVEGHQTVLTPEVKEIAKDVAKKCACLPLAIVTMAGCMRGVNDIREWRNARNAQQLMDKEERLFEQLKFSYSRLKDDKERHCFLYCALYPEDAEIYREELIEHWIAEDLICGTDNTEAMFNKGHTILNKFIKTCLLVEGDDITEESVKMHDLIREMALKITLTSPRFMVRAGEGLKRVPHKGWSEDLERVSLMQNNIKELPSEPFCPHLTTFLLGGNESKALRIPDSFFLHMRCLKVLDLSYTAIESLPNSISRLENLHQLLLCDCRQLKYVPSLEKLKALEHFELSCSQIEEVPQGIEELVNLRKLELLENRNLKYVPSLEKLEALEHFKLTYCQIKEVPQGMEELVDLRKLILQGNFNLGMSTCQKLCRLTQLHCLGMLPTNVKVSAEELLCLKQLKTLDAKFRNVQELTKYVKSGQCRSWESYDLVVETDDENNQAKKHLRVNYRRSYFNNSKYFSSYGVDAVVLPSDIEELEISSWDNHISLSDVQSLRAARSLRKFEIKECSKLESIFSSSSPSPSSSSSCFSEDYYIPLTTIEELLFHDLPNFWVLFDRVDPPHNISFNLKRLEFNECPKIKNIFSALLLHNFPNLEELKVLDCKNVEEIIVEVETSDRGGNHEDDGNTITLPNLKKLHLEELPRLESIYEGIMVCESLQYIHIWDCPMLGGLPFSSAPPALQRIFGEEEWWESLDWDNPLTKTTLQPFFAVGYPVDEDYFNDEDYEDEDEDEDEDEEEEEEEEEEEKTESLEGNEIE